MIKPKEIGNLQKLKEFRLEENHKLTRIPKEIEKLMTALRHPSEELANYKAESKLVTRMRKEFGLVNSWQSINSNQSLPQTLRWDINKIPPYHCDAIFIPCSWVKYIEKCAVINTEPWINMSDHNPILLSIKF